MAVLAATATAGKAAAWPSPHSLPGFAYVSPAPGSSLHRPVTNIIVRPGGLIDLSSMSPWMIQVTGRQSGAHPGRIKLSDDGATLLYFPDTPFAPDESVTCTIAPGIRTDTGGMLPGAEFTFRVAPASPVALRPASAFLEELDPERPRAPATLAPPSMRPVPLRSSDARTDTLPADFPAIQSSQSGDAAPGAYFLSDISFGQGPYASYLMILRQDGSPIWYRKLEDRATDFKVQPNRWLTYYDFVRYTYYALNARYALVDSFHCGNGYPSDVHELVILRNGHALLMAYDPETIDMSGIVPGGRPDATVTGLIIQELDRDKDVVFQWRSWDHFQITDATSQSLTAAAIDYAHGNAIEVDLDGNLLISSRHMDEITKISRVTGEILWRLGGKHNEFTFVNDPDGFSQQHAIRRLSNGHITLFDNGNYHTPPHSRAVEYVLDETAKTATLVWQYRNTPDTYGSAMGNAQRLANENTVIGWGAANPTITEVSPAGEKLAELSLPASIYSYRAFKFEWPPVLSADVSLDPERLSSTASDPWIRARIQSSDFRADSLDLASLRLGGVAAEGIEAGPADLDSDGRTEVVVRFPRAALPSALTPGSHPLPLTGVLKSGELVQGTAAIRAVSAKPAGIRVLSPVGASQVELVLGVPGLVGKPVRLSIYDARGRLVRQAEAASDQEGFLTWDGRDAQGRNLPSGIYHLRIDRDGRSVDGRVILVR